VRVAALLLVAVGLAPGCGLTQTHEELDFRSYPLPEVSIAQAPDLIIETTRAFYRDRFGGAGGFTLDWDEELGNLKASPVLAGRRRLRLYLSVQQEGAGSVVEMFALVETLDEASPGMQNWILPQKDVYLEEQLYEAILAEHIRRSRG
jgi:hypothetical protein